MSDEIKKDYKQGVIDGVKEYNKRIWNEVQAPLNCEQLRQIDSIAWEIEEEHKNG